MAANRFIARHGIDVNNQRVVNVPDPVDPGDLANKRFCSKITNLKNGTIKVGYGGTGQTTLNGILKIVFNSGVVSTAQPGVDYVLPTGTAASAEKLKKAVLINGIKFDFSDDIKVNSSLLKPGDIFRNNKYFLPSTRLVPGGAVYNYGVVKGNNSRIVMVGWSGQISYSDDSGNTFTIVNTTGNGTETYNGVSCSHTGVYVAVGNSGKIASSSDGINWTHTYLGTSGFSGISTCNDNFFIYGTGICYKGSSSGTGWELVTFPITFTVAKVLLVNDEYVFIGRSNKIFITKDFVNWKEITTGITDFINDAINVDGVYYLVGVKDLIYTTRDFITLQKHTSENGYYNYGPGSGNKRDNNKILFTDGTFIIIGAYNKIATSTDGVNWLLNHVELGSKNNFYDVINIGKEIFITGTSGGNVKISTGSLDLSEDRVIHMNGSTYTRSIYPELYKLYEETAVPKVTGEIWSIIKTTVKNNIITCVKYVNNQFILLDNIGNISTSIDGINWEYVTKDSYAVDIAFGNGIYVKVGSNGIKSSTDLVTWNSITISGNVVNGVVFHEGYFYITENRYVYRSTDGVTWESIFNNPNNDQLVLITYTNGHLLVLGNGKLFKRDNTTNDWVTITNTQLTYTYSVVYGNGIYVGCDMSSNLSTSIDGVTWTKRTSPVGTIIKLIFNEIVGKFYGVSSNGKVFSSTDGITWVQIYQESRTLYTLGYHQDIVLVGGNFAFLARTSNDHVFQVENIPGHVMKY